jgi:site-specific DNA recombinase
MYVLTITVHTVGVPMKATSPWQIAREIAHADPAPAAPADHVTSHGRTAREVPRGAADDTPEPRVSGITQRVAAESGAGGRRAGGPRRFGWLAGDLAEGRPHNHLLDPVESGCLRRAIEMIMAGKSEQTVIRWLVEQGVPTVRGGRWTGTTVRTMVSNPAVCGYRAHAGALVLDPRTGEPAVGGWETVATPEEWRLVVRRYEGGRVGRVADAPESRRIAQTRKYLLSGFLRCGRVNRSSGAVCAATMVGNPVTRGTPHGAYACTSPGCRGLARRMDLVDETVTALVLAELVRRYGPPEGAPDRGRGSGQNGGQNGGQAAVAVPDWPKSLLAGFTARRWAEFDLRQRRIAVAAVVEAVIVRPLPDGRSTRAPFDPELLDVLWRHG